MTNKNWMQIHTYLSLFFLPACVIYVITGVGYIFDIKENAGASIYEFSIKEPPKAGKEKEFIIKVLQDNNLKIPKNTEVKIQRGSPTMGSMKYSASIVKNKQGEPQVRVIDRGLYGILLLMHKAKGAYYFDIIAIGFAISLMLFYLSGLIMTSFCKRKRKEALIAFGLGFILTSLAIYFSVV
ncbi:hypothetical protein CQA44_03855 [Helicobacter sp. MIT 14-3879]|nr:hypothetical protein CQA44_03855 [Helicobacter sp. MIT 14-3879]